MVNFIKRVSNRTKSKGSEKTSKVVTESAPTPARNDICAEKRWDESGGLARSDTEKKEKEITQEFKERRLGWLRMGQRFEVCPRFKRRKFRITYDVLANWRITLQRHYVAGGSLRRKMQRRSLGERDRWSEKRKRDRVDDSEESTCPANRHQSHDSARRSRSESY